MVRANTEPVQGWTRPVFQPAESAAARTSMDFRHATFTWPWPSVSQAAPRSAQARTSPVFQHARSARARTNMDFNHADSARPGPSVFQAGARSARCRSCGIFSAQIPWRTSTGECAAGIGSLAIIRGYSRQPNAERQRCASLQGVRCTLELIAKQSPPDVTPRFPGLHSCEELPRRLSDSFLQMASGRATLPRSPGWRMEAALRGRTARREPRPPLPAPFSRSSGHWRS
jgi:hypothetical protein